MRNAGRLILIGTCFAVALAATNGRAAVPISSWGTVITESNTTYELTGDLV